MYMNLIQANIKSQFFLQDVAGVAVDQFKRYAEDTVIFSPQVSHIGVTFDDNSCSPRTVIWFAVSTTLAAACSHYAGPQRIV
jgi:hypothetical protein